MIEILICDDKAEWIADLKQHVQEVCPVPFHLTTFLDAKSLLDFLSCHRADILMTDIQMPDMDGITLAKAICKKNRRMQIIFTSIYTEYIQDVFVVRPVYYLTKPFNSKNVLEALRLAIHNLNIGSRALNIVSQGKSMQIPVAEIDYLESDRRYCILHCGKRSFSCISKLDTLAESLPTYFVRNHKSYCVNMRKIKRISNNQIELFSGLVLPVAKSRFSATKKTVLQFWEDQL